MAKSEKPAAPASQAKGQAQGKGSQQEETSEGAAKPKRKKLILAVVGVLVLGIMAGAGWYFTKGKSSHDEAAKKAAPVKLDQPKFIPLESFTVNLQRGEEGDQFLQVGITLKIDDPTLEEKIKRIMPEIRSRILMLLSGKRAPELVPVSGKKQLAQEILLEVNTALGIKPAIAKAVEVQPNGKQVAASGVMASEHVASGVAAHSGAASAPVNAETAAEEGQAAGAEQEAGQETGAEIAHGIQDVLFTSFIIQ